MCKAVVTYDNSASPGDSCGVRERGSWSFQRQLHGFNAVLQLQAGKCGELVLLACSGSVVAVGSLVYLCLGSQAHRADCSNDGQLQLPLG